MADPPSRRWGRCAWVTVVRARGFLLQPRKCSLMSAMRSGNHHFSIGSIDVGEDVRAHLDGALGNERPLERSTSCRKVSHNESSATSQDRRGWHVGPGAGVVGWSTGETGWSTCDRNRFTKEGLIRASRCSVEPRLEWQRPGPHRLQVFALWTRQLHSPPCFPPPAPRPSRRL